MRKISCTFVLFFFYGRYECYGCRRFSIFLVACGALILTEPLDESSFYQQIIFLSSKSVFCQRKLQTNRRLRDCKRANSYVFMLSKHIFFMLSKHTAKSVC